MRLPSSEPRCSDRVTQKCQAGTPEENVRRAVWLRDLRQLFAVIIGQRRSFFTFYLLSSRFLPSHSHTPLTFIHVCTCTDKTFPAVTHCVQLQMWFIHNWGVVFLARKTLSLSPSPSPSVSQPHTDQWPSLFECNLLLQSAGMSYSCQYLITKLCSKLPITDNVIHGSQSVVLNTCTHTHTYTHSC